MRQHLTTIGSTGRPTGIQQEEQVAWLIYLHASLSVCSCAMKLTLVGVRVAVTRPAV